LAERANRRKKLQDKLKEQEKVIESKQVTLNEKRAEVESHAQDLLNKLEDDLNKEKKEGELAINDHIEALKQEKLASFEDKLREARDGKDFGKVLEGYQAASKRVDGELEKEAAKQKADLEKALKNRRG
jgi:DNA anti-recombination protein RmuC